MSLSKKKKTLQINWCAELESLLVYCLTREKSRKKFLFLKILQNLPERSNKENPPLEGKGEYVKEFAQARWLLSSC